MKLFLTCVITIAIIHFGMTALSVYHICASWMDRDWLSVVMGCSVFILLVANAMALAHLFWAEYRWRKEFADWENEK